MRARSRDRETGRRGDKEVRSSAFDSPVRGEPDLAVRRGRGPAPHNESGYALLLIFAMAATIAIMLYVQLPRVAFEKQRDREQMLIQRGEQYKRAIQLYFRKFKNYPPTMEALENTNNIRFLRRRYTDPLTGKDEWRLIHVGPGGIFTDSLTQKPKVGSGAAATNLNTFITEAASIGSGLPDNQRGAAGPPRRASDGGPQPGSDGTTSGGVPGQTDPNQPGLAPGQTGVAPGQTGYPGGTTMPGVPSGGNFPPGLPGAVGQPTDPSQSIDPITGNQGATGNQQGMNAADLIGNLLRQPRPIPSPASPGGPTGIAGGGGMVRSPGASPGWPARSRSWASRSTTNGRSTTSGNSSTISARTARAPGEWPARWGRAIRAWRSSREFRDLAEREWDKPPAALECSPE